MELPGNGLPWRREGPRWSHRAASNVSSSSTSSGILVAPGPPISPQRQLSVSRSPEPFKMAKTLVKAEIRGGNVLVVRVLGDTHRAFLSKLAEDDRRVITDQPTPTSPVDSSTEVKEEIRDDDQNGPNRRGTFSKQYVLQHPDIKWVHRGQGRYLPAEKAHPTASKSSDLQSVSIHSWHQFASF